MCRRCQRPYFASPAPAAPHARQMTSLPFSHPLAIHTCGRHQCVHTVRAQTLNPQHKGSPATGAGPQWGQGGGVAGATACAARGLGVGGWVARARGGGRKGRGPYPTSAAAMGALAIRAAGLWRYAWPCWSTENLAACDANGACAGACRGAARTQCPAQPSGWGEHLPRAHVGGGGGARVQAFFSCRQWLPVRGREGGPASSARRCLHIKTSYPGGEGVPQRLSPRARTGVGAANKAKTNIQAARTAAALQEPPAASEGVCREVTGRIWCL
jgi:hypothetical protein